MNDAFLGDVRELVHSMCRNFLGDEIGVELDARPASGDALWTRIAVYGERPLLVWVGASRGLLERFSNSVFSGEPYSESDVQDTAREIANIVGGNLKALLAPSGSMGLPELCAQGRPQPNAGEREVRLSIDGHPMSVLIGLG
ncbi:MAG: chemotaxis protein CheX [Polyangiaceae bacterium]